MIHSFTQSENATANFDSRPLVVGILLSQSRNENSEKDESEIMHRRGLSIYSYVNVVDTIINDIILM